MARFCPHDGQDILVLQENGTIRSVFSSQSTLQHLKRRNSPLQGLTNLTWLVLGNNEITDISPLQGLNNLRDLELWGSEITDISPLQGLNNLTRLGLGDNPISQSQKDDLQRALPNCRIDIDIDF